MATSQEIINVGASANDGAGDPLRTAFTKTNNNFSTLFASSSSGSIANGTSNISILTNAQVLISSAGTSNVLVVSSTGATITGLLSTTGNITGGNIRTDGVVSAGGNILVASGKNIGVGTTTPDTEVTILGSPQTVSYALTGNSTTLGTDLHITGADSANTRITQDAFGTGSYVAFTGRTARGTAATPAQTQSGDVLTQFTARGFSNGSLQFGNSSTGRVDIVAAENFADASRATSVLVYTTPTGAITPVATATFDSTGAFSATGNITGGTYVKTSTTTVASLPTASTAGAGARAFVTNANATTFNAVVGNGGGNSVPVFSDGTNWRIG
jgi:trimeric autotransporter adhesin